MRKIDMTARLTGLCTAGLLALSTAAWAQTTDDTTAPQTEDAPAAEAPASDAPAAEAPASDAPAAEGDTPAPEGDAPAPGIESQLSLGEDADAPADLGQPYVRETNGAWELRCLRTEDPENDPCQMYQLVEDGNNQPVVEFTLFRLPGTGQAKAGATVIVPLETSLPNQLTIRIDSGAAKRYPFAFCNQLGCYARIGLTEADVNAFKRGAEATLTIIPALAPDQKVDLKLSLSGFTASYDKASVIEQ